MDSENKSLIDASFDSWRTLPLAGKLLIGGTGLIWIIWMFWIAVAPGAIESNTGSEQNSSYLPAISESDSQNPTVQSLTLDEATQATTDQSEVYLPNVADDDGSEEPIVIVVNEGRSEADTQLGSGTVFTIDPERSVASYSAVEEFFGESGLVVGRNTNEGLNTAVGETRGLTGSLMLDMTAGQPALTGGAFTADLLQLKSVQPHRDQTIKRYWLESNKFPTATFEITQVPTLPPGYIEGTSAVFPLTGLLTVREIEKEVTFHVTATLEDGVLEALATTELMFADFGIDPPNMANVLSVEPSFSIIVSITAVAE